VCARAKGKPSHVARDQREEATASQQNDAFKPVER